MVAKKNGTGGTAHAMLAMLRYAMLCYAMLCYAMLCYAMLRCAVLCYAVLCRGAARRNHGGTARAESRPPSEHYQVSGDLIVLTIRSPET